MNEQEELKARLGSRPCQVVGEVKSIQKCIITLSDTLIDALKALDMVMARLEPVCTPLVRHEQPMVDIPEEPCGIAREVSDACERALFLKKGIVDLYERIEL